MVGQATVPRAMAAGSSSGGGGASNFARMLASSRLASHTPAVPQIYTAPEAHIARGDFGLKRPLPLRSKPVGSVRYVAVEAVDTREGQTAWVEREHAVLVARRFRELNVRLWNARDPRIRPDKYSTSSRREAETRGMLGPRISTSFDPSTRRSVPSTYAGVQDEQMRTHLQHEAQMGRGPVYQADLHTGEAVAKGLDHEGPFGRVARFYTHTVPMPLEYRDMDERTFERYLDHIRSQRSQYRERSSFRAAREARREVARKYEAQREKAVSVQDGAAPVTSSVAEHELPLPSTTVDDADSINTDLWDESRCDKSNSGIWRPWLQWQDEIRSAKPNDQRLPNLPSPNGTTQNAPMHPQGGLQYGQPDAIQTQLLADAVPARLLERSTNEYKRGAILQRNRNTQQHGAHVAVGGQMAFMKQTAGPTSRLIDWTQREPSKGVVHVKPTQATISVANAYNDPLPAWGTKGKQYDKSASASMLIQRANANSHAKPSATDPLRRHALPPQFGAINMTLRAAISDGDGVPSSNSALARGQPGSAAWAGAIDGNMGYRPGEAESAPMNFTALNMADSASLGGGQGVGSGMYSRRERDAMVRHKARLANESANRSKTAAYNAAGNQQRGHIEAMISSVQSSSQQNRRSSKEVKGERKGRQSSSTFRE